MKKAITDHTIKEANPVKTKRIQSGISTSDVVCSSYSASNDDVFPKILSLYAEDGNRIADITYGKGVFWRNVNTARFDFYPSDIKTGVDCRELPYEDSFFDLVVFDPPYMEGLFRRDTAHLAGGGTYAPFREFYSNGHATENGPKYHDAVLDLYIRTSIEVRRVLKDKGFFVVKCQDEVSANRQKLTHVELVYIYERLGFYCKDLFVVQRQNAPGVSRLLKQQHSRKSHSYFLVFQNFNGKLPYSNFREELLVRYGLSVTPRP
jgi:hypothetical protein